LLAADAVMLLCSTTTACTPAKAKAWYAASISVAVRTSADTISISKPLAAASISCRCGCALGSVTSSISPIRVAPGQPSHKSCRSRDPRHSQALACLRGGTRSSESGQAAAAPPTNVMNCRRFMGFPSSPRTEIYYIFDSPGRREAAAPGQVVAGRLRRTRNTRKFDIEKFTMKLAMTASSFASHTGKSRSWTATTSAAVLASHPAMPDATKVK
jgi:hypothetical protein